MNNPSARKRSARACLFCKTSKKRCDARLPCSLCLGRGRGHLCSYAPRSPVQSRSAAERLPVSLSSRGNLDSTGQCQSTAETRGSTPRLGSLVEQVATRDSMLLNFQGGQPTGRNSSETRDSTPLDQRPTMLLSSRGEQVYIGNVAALSFLQFLQKTLKRYVGPSIFTNRESIMLEAEIENGDGNFDDDITNTEKEELVQCFLRISNGILHLFSNDEIKHLLDSDDSTSLYLMMAIGAQCRGRDTMDLKRATRYFSQVRKAAFVDMLQDPSINMIRNFLLMAIYMLGACRRNAALMYIGVASKAATILGLHVSNSQDRDVRQRIWMSLCVMDRLCSSILAQPSSIPSSKREDCKFIDAKDHRILALKANFECCSIIEAIMQSFTRSSTIDVSTAESHLQSLREWSQALPDTLRNASSPPNSEVTIGNIHVACAYYFGVILVTRQFLITHVTSRLRGRGDQSSDEKVSQFSEGCVSSATYMAQLCHGASQCDILLGNMCILKAWLFSAGLVLGFSLLLKGEDRSSTDKAFSDVRETLQKLARLSPQAEQYYTILTNFSAAIDLYQQQIITRPTPGNPYVDEIMTISTGGHIPVNQEDHVVEEIGFVQNDIDLEMSFGQLPVGQDIGLQLLWDTYYTQLPSLANFGEEDEVTFI